MKLVDHKVLNFLEDAPLFFQPWWLEAVSPGAWDYITVYRGEEVAAVLPYTFKLRLNQFLLIEMSGPTPYLGPWLRTSTAKYANRLGEEKDLLSELIAGLPSFATFVQNFHPSITNWLPFLWKGFQQTTRYTYRIQETKDLDALWAETRDNVRTDIKKARKQLELRETDDIQQLLQLYRHTFSRQRKLMPYPESQLVRIDAACAEHKARKIIIAVDTDGREHAGVCLLRDNSTVYYFLSGSDPLLRASGAVSLLIWEGIRWASQQGKEFDFEGSMVESIERSFRSYGARQVPYFQIKKCNSRTVTLYRTLWRLTHAQD